MGSMRTIGEVAAVSGVTVRTLHHYDRIGLLKPLARSESGYRLYGRDELLRLREILVWRRLGFSLADIAALIDESGHDRLEALEHQLQIADSQLDRSQSLVRGLKAALATLAAGLAAGADEVFSGFDQSLGEDHDDVEAQAAKLPEAAPAGHDLRAPSAARAPRREDLGGSGSMRIVATDPIRLAESVIALGIRPVGTGTYEDRFTGELDPGEWTWPPLVEQSVREPIADVGFYGSDAERIGALAPDLIIDLTSYSDRYSCLSEPTSNGRYGYDALSSIARTELVPYFQKVEPRPAFRHFLRGVAAAIGREQQAEALLALWDARASVLGAVLSGAGEVSVVATWGPGSVWGDAFYAPTEWHYCQVFTEVGISPVHPSGAVRSARDAVTFDARHLEELDTDILFFHTRRVSRGHVDRLLSSKPVADLRAARCGHVFELGWEFVNSGWFSAHWQLVQIAHAFGVTQLVAGDGPDLVLAAADPRSGTLALTAVDDGGVAVLSGPGMEPMPVELSSERVTRIDAGPDTVRSLAGLPERYALHRAGRTTPLLFTHDRESAVARLRGSAVTPAWSPRPNTLGRQASARTTATSPAVPDR